MEPSNDDDRVGSVGFGREGEYPAVGMRGVERIVGEGDELQRAVDDGHAGVESSDESRGEHRSGSG